MSKKIGAGRKRQYLCIDGPLEGERLWLSGAQPATMVMTIKGQTGHYVQDRKNQSAITWSNNQ